MVSVQLEGVLIVVAMGCSLFVLAVLISLGSRSKWKHIQHEKITQPVIRSWKDTMVQATILIEFFQFVAIAPRLESFEAVVRIISNLFLVDVIKMTGSAKDGYWTLLLVIISAVLVWIVLILLIFCNADRACNKCPGILKSIQTLNSAYLPFVGNVMFLPTATLLIDPFVCDHEAQGRTFVWRDWYMTCWTSTHMSYIIMSSICIAFYIPIAVFSRPVWQQAKTGLNIMSRPSFLLTKTCLQVLLIAVGKSLQGISILSHGFIFTVIMCLFAYYVFKRKPFNYGRCNLWQFASLIALAYISILSVISNIQGDKTNILYFIVLAIGWGSIALLAYFFQRRYLPDYLSTGLEKSKRQLDPKKHMSSKVMPTWERQSGGSMKQQSISPIDSAEVSVDPSDSSEIYDVYESRRSFSSQENQISENPENTTTQVDTDD